MLHYAKQNQRLARIKWQDLKKVETFTGSVLIATTCLCILPSGTSVRGVETGAMKTGTGVVASCTDAVNSGAETGGTG